MKNTIALLDRARKMCSPQTDYELAKQLNVTRFRFSNWRRRKATPDNEAAFKIAKMLGMQAADVVAYFEEDRAKTSAQREFWRRELPRLLPSIALAATLAWAARGTLIDGKARTSDKSLDSSAAYQLIHYAKLILSLLTGLATTIMAPLHKPRAGLTRPVTGLAPTPSA